MHLSVANPVGLRWEHGVGGSLAYHTTTIPAQRLYGIRRAVATTEVLFATIRKDATGQWVAATTTFDGMTFVPTLAAGITHVEALWALQG